MIYRYIALLFPSSYLMSEIAEDEDAVSERRKIRFLVDCCQVEKPFLNFFVYLFQ